MILSIDPIKYPLTGIGRYTYELAKHLLEDELVERLCFLRGHHFVQSLPVPGESSSPIRSVRGLFLKSRLAVAFYQLFSSPLKAQCLRGKEDNVYHGPNFYLPRFGGPSVVTIHDLSVYAMSDCHPPERVRYMHDEIELSLKRASMIITDSEYTRKEVVEYFGWPLDKIRAVPLASSGDFFPRDENELEILQTRYNVVPDGYCLFAGTIEPRKNILALLEAYELLPKAVRRHWPLVIVGYRGWNSEKLHQRLRQAENEGWLYYLGFVSADELSILFAGARMFVFPSLYEGFGLPVVEAMASGVPVVCSNAASLPEVAGDAAALFDPSDVDALSSCIRVGLEDNQWREDARRKGLVRASHFSWKRCAKETALVYQDVVS
ncbi:glycosyltransferase family 4 protein [Desulfogranum marinum]|uniref:glycosyltransferase family 4 protein n=1 Tax=Desulfogranum marinum TaxID=453220 RepID=UPI002FCB8EC8